VRSQNVCASSAYLTKSVTINNCPRLSQAPVYTIQIRPNPWNQSTFITIPEGSNTAEYTLLIYDFLGRAVYALSAPDKETHINRSILKTGIYTVVLRFQNERIATERMVVE
ncbi:MAG: T9SS type A sorting domain-containing protein, partial [Bacteroidota bacterium]